MDHVERAKTRLDAAKTEMVKFNIFTNQRHQLAESLAKTTDELTLAEMSRELLNALVNHKKRSTLDKIEHLVTYGLRTIFENEDYQFKVNTDVVRKQVAYTFSLNDGGHQSTDVMESRGGGVVNVVAFLLALVVQLMLDPKARFFVLDEKFANVSSLYVPNVAELLATLAAKMKVQFLQISHQDALTEGSDVVYTVTKDRDGVARIQRR